MARKTFVIFLLIQVFIFILGFAIKNYQPEAEGIPDIKQFPLEKGGWVGRQDDLVPYIVEMLNPTEIFSATFTNQQGIEVHLFFDYFAGQSNPGGPHSPRNCVPGSGWSILKEDEREIVMNGRIIKIGSFNISRGESRMIMDYWYLTRFGETANDYIFRFYSMISALTFRPNDVAFIRILAERDPESIAALKDFEDEYVEEIYSYLGFK